MENKTKKLLILLGVIVVIVIIIIVAASEGKKSAKQSSSQTAGQPAPAAGEETAEPAETAVITPVAEILKEARVEVPGANPITKDNKVVTAEGKPTLTNVPASSAQAPQQTLPVVKEQLSDKVIKLDISASAGFSPKEFTVKAGEPVTISLTNQDNNSSHTFSFLDKVNLSAVIIGVARGETRAITFNVPTKIGEYAFHCGIPTHDSRGEVGKMIVK